MARTLRPLSLGQILDETFNIYRNNFVLFITISAIPNAIVLVLQLGLDSTINANSGSGTILIALGGLAAVFAALFATSLVTAATTLGVSDIYLETPTSASSCFSRVSDKVLPVLGVSIAVGFIILIGCILLIIPGIYWAGLYGLAVPAVVLENIAPGQGLKRSSTLASGSVGRVIVVYFLAAVLAFIMALVLKTILSTVGSAFASHGIAKAAWDQVISTITTILFGPISAIAITLTYYDQRIRREAFDISHMMSLMNKTAPDLEARGMNS
jgi:hypothetical protein